MSKRKSLIQSKAKVFDCIVERYWCSINAYERHWWYSLFSEDRELSSVKIDTAYKNLQWCSLRAVQVLPQAKDFCIQEVCRSEV